MHAGTRSALASIWAAMHSPTGLPFPSIISHLTSLGITRYRVDYITRSITAYTSTAPSADTTPFPSSHEHAYTFGKWDEEGVVAAHRRMQAGEGTFLAFSEEVVRSGVVEYTVYVFVGKVVYGGGEGEVWVERFDGGRGEGGRE